MRALIVESNEKLGKVWKSYLEGLDVAVTLSLTGEDALERITETVYDVIVLDLVLNGGSALAIADLAYFRQPSANVVFVTDTTFFSDGSIFRHSPNARAFIEARTSPQDLAAIVHHYGASRPDHVAQTGQLVG